MTEAVHDWEKQGLTSPQHCGSCGLSRELAGAWWQYTRGGQFFGVVSPAPPCDPAWPRSFWMARPERNTMTEPKTDSQRAHEWLNRWYENEVPAASPNLHGPLVQLLAEVRGHEQDLLAKAQYRRGHANGARAAGIVRTCELHALTRAQHCDELEKAMIAVPQEFVEGEGETPSGAVQRLADAYQVLTQGRTILQGPEKVTVGWVVRAGGRLHHGAYLTPRGHHYTWAGRSRAMVFANRGVALDAMRDVSAARASSLGGWRFVRLVRTQVF